jgi:hypothetical protein
MRVSGGGYKASDNESTSGVRTALDWEGVLHLGGLELALGSLEMPVDVGGDLERGVASV